jgi:hypothetical protein
MKKFLLDTGIAGDYIDHRLGVYERAREEVARGNRVGIGMPVLGRAKGGRAKGVRSRFTGSGRTGGSSKPKGGEKVSGIVLLRDRGMGC